jgi:GH15 family glucan-1,4-alpha-glucosidase
VSCRIRRSYCAKVKGPGSLTVSARKLFELVKEINGEVIRVRGLEKHRAEVLSGETRLNLAGRLSAQAGRIASRFGGPAARGWRPSRDSQDTWSRPRRSRTRQIIPRSRSVATKLAAASRKQQQVRSSPRENRIPLTPRNAYAPRSMGLRIEDYGMIGNTRTAALVGNNGSIDWLCVPRFDSGACFAALLGSPADGHWKIAPAVQVRKTRRRYIGPTLIFENEFETDGGTVAVIDFMPIAERDQRMDIARVVRGVRGSVPMRMELAIRFDYGRVVPWVTRLDHGARAIAGPDAVELRTQAATQDANHTISSDFNIAEGQTIPFTLEWYPSHETASSETDPMRMLEETEAWWQKWSSRCTLSGPWRDLALRSLITLKALTYAPTGGIVAAPTASLPEWIGGARNWDYRYCWLRDATLTLYALMISGYTEEAFAWRDWLLRTVAGNPNDLQILYGIAGERRVTELELPWLAGYENSRPVRIGNAAHEQFQLDVYGEILGAFDLGRRLGAHSTPEIWRLVTAFLEHLEKVWSEPDEGIWEVRGPRRQFTHSKVMAWLALDRAVKALEAGIHQGPLERWRKLRDRIHRDVCENGFNRRRNAFVQYYGSDTLDAAVLMIPMVGFLPADDPRVLGTIEAIQRELVSDGLVLRYRTEEGVDGLPAGEGVFLPCSFWLVDNLVLAGRRGEAEELFRRLASLCNDVGLIGEEYDPAAHRLLGNFPQAFTHVSLVNTVRTLTTGVVAAAGD